MEGKVGLDREPREQTQREECRERRDKGYGIRTTDGRGRGGRRGEETERKREEGTEK